MKIIEVIVAVVIGLILLNWLQNSSSLFASNSPGGIDPMFGGWPYGAPLSGPPPTYGWAPPFGAPNSSYFGFNWGPNAGNDVSFGYQGYGL